MRLLILVAACLSLVACATSPGRGCESVAAEASASGKDTQAAASTARTGQDTSGEQLMQDTVPAKPGVTWNRGEGNVEAANAWEENRSQSGAPVVSQGLLFPANATAKNTKVSGVHPLIAALQQQIFTTNARLDVAVATGNTALADNLRGDIKELLAQMQTAAQETAQTVTHNYNFEGSIINQGVSSSSGANATPSGAKTGDGETSTGQSVPEMLKSAGVQPAPAVPDSPPSDPVDPE